MRHASKLLCAALTGALLAGCAGYQPPQEQAGMVIGGVVGGVVGSELSGRRGRTPAIILGTIAGAAIGGAIGRSMAETDRIRMAQALETARTGQPTVWRNPDTGSQYTVVPNRTYTQPSGPCREYTMDAIIAGRSERVVGTACRQPDGTWQVRN